MAGARTTAGLEPNRVAEVLVRFTDRGRSSERRGSGYLLSGARVLTAAHVVRDADQVRVRFDADTDTEWTALVEDVWSDPVGDVALLSLAGGHSVVDISPVRFGRIGDRDAVLPFSTVGFPRFKLRDDTPLGGAGGRYRDSHHAVGTAAALSNRKDGTLELTVAPPEADPDSGHSAWEGMSGAAVWAQGRIVGLVAAHHRSDGLNRLTAVRVDRWYGRLSVDSIQILREAGIPAAATELVDVIPPDPATRVMANYLAQIEDIAPPVLRGRDEEIAEVTEFCARDEPYQWWQGSAWTGKTALAAWIVLHPPAGVTVASFFITGRLVGQADSVAYTEALIEQLALIAGEDPTLAVTAAARDGQRRRLLRSAAERVGDIGGRRLLLVVDGLDEDRGVPPAGASSIASLLPSRLPPNVRVLVTSRVHPGVPVDVPGEHPLRACSPHRLSPSSYAGHLRDLARVELLEHLQGQDSLSTELIAYVTASGGGLSGAELSELTQTPRLQVTSRLEGALGRSLTTRLNPDGPEGLSERVYLFQHETLRETAFEQLSPDLARYRQAIYDWADTYRARGWPADTPAYLLRPYARMLADNRETERLSALAIDPSRSSLLFAVTRGDAAAQAEIFNAQQLQRNQPEPDLTGLVLLALRRRRLDERNAAVGALPELLVRLGDTQRGIAMSHGHPDVQQRAHALVAVTRALVDAGQPDRARETAAAAAIAACAVHSDDADAITDLVEPLVATGHTDAARVIAESWWRLLLRADDPPRLDQALGFARAWRDLGDLDRAADAVQIAEGIVETLDLPGERVSGLMNVAHTLKELGHLEQAADHVDAAERLAYVQPSPDRTMLVNLSTHLFRLGYHQRALAALEHGHSLTASRVPFDMRGQIRTLALDAAAEGELEIPVHAVRLIDAADDAATILAAISETYHEHDAHDAARAAATAALAAAESAGDSPGGALALANVAHALALCGLRADATRTAERVLSRARYGYGQLDAWMVGQLVPTLVLLDQESEASGLVAQCLEQALHEERPERRAEVLIRLAPGFIALQQFDHLDRVRTAVVDAVHSSPWPREFFSLLSELSRHHAEIGAIDAVIELATLNTSRVSGVEVLIPFGESLRVAGNVVDARRVAAAAERIADGVWQSEWMTDALVTVGVRASIDHDWAGVRASFDAIQNWSARAGAWMTLLADGDSASVSAHVDEVVDEILRGLEQFVVQGENDDQLDFVAVTLNKTGNAGAALEIARLISDPWRRETRIADIATTAARHGESGAAERAANAAMQAFDHRPPIDRAELLIAVGRLAEAGQVATAVVETALVDAVEAAEAGNATRGQAEALTTLAALFTKPGQHLADIIAEATMQAWRQDGWSPDESLLPTDPEDQCRTLTRAALVLAAVGEPVIANVMLEAAQALLEAIDRRKQPDFLAALIHAALNLNGPMDSAVAQLVKNLIDETIALIDAFAGDEADGHAVAARAGQEIVDALIKSGRTELLADLRERTVAYAKLIVEPEGRAQALLAISETCAKSGNTAALTTVADDLAQAASEVDDPEVRARLFAHAALLAAECGRPIAAEELLSEAVRFVPLEPHIDHRSPFSLETVPARFAATGQPDLAVTVTLMLPNHEQRATGLVRAAGVLADHGDRRAANRLITTAEEAARLITSAQTQAHVLADIAIAMTQWCGQLPTDQADPSADRLVSRNILHRLLAEVLTGPVWHRVIGPVLAFSPGSRPAVAAALQNLD